MYLYGGDSAAVQAQLIAVQQCKGAGAVTVLEAISGDVPRVPYGFSDFGGDSSAVPD